MFFIFFEKIIILRLREWFSSSLYESKLSSHCGSQIRKLIQNQICLRFLSIYTYKDKQTHTPKQGMLHVSVQQSARQCTSKAATWPLSSTSFVPFSCNPLTQHHPNASPSHPATCYHHGSSPTLWRARRHPLPLYIRTNKANPRKLAPLAWAILFGRSGFLEVLKELQVQNQSNASR